MKVKSESEVAQSCPTLSDPMDCSLPGSSVHGIFQARVLEWGAIAGKGYPLQCSGLENSMNCIVHGFAKNQTRLSDFTHSLMIDSMDMSLSKLQEMVKDREPGVLQPMGCEELSTTERLNNSSK